MAGLNNKKIILGVTGGIAAYKACEIVRLMIKQGADVHVVLSHGAKQFVTELTIQALSTNPVRSNIFDLTEESQMGHIELAESADLILVAPATANFIAKTAHGMADDLLTTLLLVTKSPIVIAPAMNVNMYQHPLTQENIKKLESLSINIIEPTSGDLACGYTGQGRLEEPSKIVEYISGVLA